MRLDEAANCLEALGSSHRLGIYRLLVESGVDGLPVGQIKDRLGLPGSTLSHHIAKLVNQGLVNQQRESRNLICCCNYKLMDELIGFLTENCCQGSDCFDAAEHE